MNYDWVKAIEDLNQFPDAKTCLNPTLTTRYYPLFLRLLKMKKYSFKIKKVFIDNSRI